MKALIILVATISLISCSSSEQAEQIANYYVLNGANQHTPMQIANKQVVYLSRITLAEYLQQQNMAMQLGSNKIHYSLNHLWAESLDTSIEKALLQDLNAQSNQHYFVGHNMLPAKFSWELVVQIDHFVPTDQSQVIVNGRFWLINHSNAQLNQHQSFKFSQSLNQDGYAHAVSELRALLAQLATDINGQLSQ